MHSQENFIWIFAVKFLIELSRVTLSTKPNFNINPLSASVALI